MFTGLSVARFDRMFRHPVQVRFCWAANSLRIGEGFREKGLREAEKLGVVEIVKQTLPFS